MLTGLRTRQERTFRMSRGTTFRTTRLTKTSSPLNNWTNVNLLAGAGGLEPPNGGIKIRCLTTWLRPISGGLLAPQRRADHSGRAVGDQRRWSEAHLPLTDAWSELD